MARLPQAFIDQVLDRTDIVDVVDRRVKLKKAGKNYSACCPFHQEKTPSFSVNPEKQFYYCFGCGAGGNALGFVMDYERMEFRGAISPSHKQLAWNCQRRNDATPQIDHQKPLYESMEKARDCMSHFCGNIPLRGVLSTTLNNAVYQVRSPETFDWVLRLKGGITS